MAIVDEGSAGTPTNDDTFGATLVFTTSQIVNVGETLLFGISNHSSLGVITGISDGGLNTYVEDKTQDGPPTVKIWRASVTTQIPSSTNITITWTTAGGVHRQAMGWVFSGLDASPKDQVSSGFDFSTVILSGNTPATTVADELVFGVMALNEVGDIAVTAPAAELAEFDSPEVTTVIAKLVVAATGAQHIDGTGPNADWTCAVVTYKAASTPSTGLAWIRA